MEHHSTADHGTSLGAGNDYGLSFYKNYDSQGYSAPVSSLLYQVSYKSSSPLPAIDASSPLFFSSSLLSS